MNNDDTIEKLPINIRLRRWAAIPGADGVPLLLRAADTIEEQNTEIERLRNEYKADLACPIGIIGCVPTNGAWFVYGTDYNDYPLALFSDELSAHRWAAEHCWGWGKVVFWPFGKDWKEVQK